MAIDSVGRIAWVNRTATIMFRCSAELLIGAEWQRFVCLGGRLPSEGMLYDVNCRRADGTEFASECGFTDVRLNDAPATLCVVRDATERRQLERQVLDVSEQLQRQIGQDLHDGLGQLLTGTAFLAKGLESHIAPDYRPQAQRVVELINQSIANVRDLARGVSSIHVETHSLTAVMEHVVSESKRLLGVECSLEIDGMDDEAHRPATLMQLHLIAREAINNAFRHGHARRVEVLLRREFERNVLTITDDGVGFDPSVAPIEGLGLGSMRHRAAMIGGHLELHRRGPGMIVRCSWHD